jgi:hypothetical protein
MTRSMQFNAKIYENELQNEIRPYSKNPWYWEYKGEPIMLIGTSDRDNLWQWTGRGTY